MRTDRTLGLALTAFGLLGISLAGCWSSEPSVPPAVQAPGADATADKPADGSKPADAADEEVLLKPFTPPPLAEIDAKAEWEDLPVVDAMVLLREKQAMETPAATVQEALGLQNINDETNDKILGALGRLPAKPEDVDEGATIRRHLRGDVKSTNPIMISSVQEFDVAGLIGFGMFSFDWNMQTFAIKESVVSWQTSKDRMYDKVVMRDDLTWSDGKPITAHDVVFTFKTIMNPRVPVPAVRSGTDQLRWVEAYDDHTLVFFHKEALATNANNINFPVIPKHIYESTIEKDVTLQDSAEHVKYENKPIAGGPYEIAERSRGQEIVLRRRESYYMHNGKQVRDKPFFKEIRFRIIEDSNTALLALKSGEVDDLEMTPEQWMTQTIDDEFYKVNTKAKGLEWVNFQFTWNLDKPYFNDVRVRQAMSYAVNYDELLEKLCYGLYQPCNGIFHPEAWMAPKKPLPFYKQDLSKAEDLLDEAGWIDHDGDGTRDKEVNGESLRFEFNVICSSQQLRIAICTLLKENLDQIGVVCNVRPLEPTVLQQKMLEHDFDAAYGGWGTGTDPDTSENIWKTGQARNYGKYSNPEVDKLYEQGKREFDREKRAAVYAKIHELIYADQPCTWLFYQSAFYGFNEQLRGYSFSPRGPYHYSPGFSSLWKPAAQ